MALLLTIMHAPPRPFPGQIPGSARFDPAKVQGEERRDHPTSAGGITAIGGVFPHAGVAFIRARFAGMDDTGIFNRSTRENGA